MVSDDETRQTRLAALAVIELAMRHPSRTKANVEEYDALFADADAEGIARAIAAVLVGAAEQYDVPLAEVIEDYRRNLVGE